MKADAAPWPNMALQRTRGLVQLSLSVLPGGGSAVREPSAGRSPLNASSLDRPTTLVADRGRS